MPTTTSPIEPHYRAAGRRGIPIARAVLHRRRPDDLTTLTHHTEARAALARATSKDTPR